MAIGGKPSRIASYILFTFDMEELWNPTLDAIINTSCDVDLIRTVVLPREALQPTKAHIKLITANEGSIPGGKILTSGLLVTNSCQHRHSKVVELTFLKLRKAWKGKKLHTPTPRKIGKGIFSLTLKIINPVGSENSKKKMYPGFETSHERLNCYFIINSNPE